MVGAKDNEMFSLRIKNTWDLVDLPVGRNPAGYKWIYKRKLNDKGEFRKYNARL